MSALGGIGGLLGGFTEEAAKIKQERFQQDQANSKMAVDMLTHIIDNPNVQDPNIKAQAMHAYRDLVMTHLFPDQFKKDTKNPVHKLIDNFIGAQQPQTPAGMMSAFSGQGGQPGVGRGKATSQVGASQPIPDPQQMQGSIPSSLGAGQLDDGSTVPLPPQGMQAPVAGSSVPAPPWQPPQPATPNDEGFVNQADASRFADYQKMQDQSNISLDTNKKANIMIMPFDFGPLKKGETTDIRNFPLLEAYVKNSIPDLLPEAITTPDGMREIHWVDKKTQKEVSVTKVAEVMDAVRGIPTEMVKAFQREHDGKLPGMADIMNIAKELETQKTQITVNTNQTATGANDPEVISSYVDELFDGRSTPQQIPVTGGVRNKVTKEFRQRIEAGEKPPVPLTAAAQTTLATTAPVMDLVKQLKAKLEPFKDDNTPMSEFLARTKYSIGLSTNESGEIAKAELLKIMGAARVLKGTSRNMTALEIAMEHLPNIRKDSAKLMYEKLESLQQNLLDIKSAAYLYGNKYGYTPPQEETPPPPEDDDIVARYKKFKEAREAAKPK